MIGVDIGSAFIKAIDVVKQKGHLAISAVGLVETPADTVANGVVVDPVAVGSALRSLLTSNNFKGKRAVISVGGQSSLAVRVVDLPKMSDSELRRSMRLDLERHLPFPVEGTVHDFAKISPPDAGPDDQGIEVLLAAAQQPLIEGHVKVLDEARIYPIAIDIEPLALCRSLVSARANGGPRTVAIVNMGAQLTEICVVRDGLLRFVRSAPLAGDAFTNAVGQNLVIDSKQAESIKRQYATILLEERLEGAAPEQPPAAATGFHTPLDIVPEEKGEEEKEELEFGAPPPLPEVDELTMPADESSSPGAAGRTGAGAPSAEGAASPRVPQQASASQAGSGGQSDEEYTRHQISEALVGPLADLAREVHATFDYFSTRKGLEVERVLLVGGSSQIRNLAEFMTRELGVETLLATPFENLTLAAPSVSPDFLSSVAPFMAVCTGLAMRDLL
jgi:type IV pilus assembly protein PilM